MYCSVRFCSRFFFCSSFNFPFCIFSSFPFATYPIFFCLLSFGFGWPCATMRNTENLICYSFYARSRIVRDFWCCARARTSFCHVHDDRKQLILLVLYAPQCIFYSSIRRSFVQFRDRYAKYFDSLFFFFCFVSLDAI